MTCTGPIWGTTLVSKYFWWNLYNWGKFHQNLTNHSVLIKNTLREREVVPFVLLESHSTLDKISRSRNGIEVKLLPQCLQTTDGDWWCQYLCQVTGVYPLDWKIYYTHIYIIHHWKTLECSLYFITFWCSSWNDCGLSTKANWTLDLAGQKIFFPKKAAQKVLPHLNFLSLIL